MHTHYSTSRCMYIDFESECIATSFVVTNSSSASSGLTESKYLVYKVTVDSEGMC